jgi:hypothetical protein
MRVVVICNDFIIKPQLGDPMDQSVFCYLRESHARGIYGMVWPLGVAVDINSTELLL